MEPDDPRHGEYAGAVQHWFDKERPCDLCTRAEWRYRKTRQLRHLRGDTPNVPSIGTVRRYQALMALGWTGPEIAEACGISINSLRSIDYHGSTVVRRETADAVAAAYERMSMTIPDGHYANRSRAIARSRGWPPPLAWDDIDDEHERPRGWQHKDGIPRKSRVDILTELDDMHAGITKVCKVLRVKRQAVEKWCARHDMSDLYSRLVAREQPRYVTNQHMERTA